MTIVEAFVEIRQFWPGGQPFAFGHGAAAGRLATGFGRALPAELAAYLDAYAPAADVEFDTVGNLLRRVRDFRGSVGAAGFSISRVIDYHNSMLPRIEGWVVAGPDGGSRLRLHHRLATFTLIFGAVWLLGVGSFATASLPLLAEAVWAGRWRKIDAPDFIPLGMLAFGGLLLSVPFWLEVR